MKHIQILSATYFLLLVCLSIRCHNDVTEPPPKSPPYDLRKIIPLAVGNSWKYRIIRCGIDGCDTTLDSTQIVDTVRINGEKYYKYNGTPPRLSFGYSGDYLETLDSSDYSMYICFNCLQEFHNRASSQSDQWMPLHVLKTPLIKGNQWHIAEWDSTFGTLTIVNPDTTIQHGGNLFKHAIWVSRNEDLGWESFLIVPGIGVVLEGGALLDSWSSSELIAWNLDSSGVASITNNTTADNDAAVNPVIIRSHTLSSP